MRAALFALLAATAVSGCGGPSPNPAEAECRAQVPQDPAVRQMIALQAGSLWLQKDQQAALREAKRQALLACLRARGLAPPGGVEAPKAPTATFRNPF